MAANTAQSGTQRSLSRFLVNHEECGVGFDVAHPSGVGSGRVELTCRGCGARFEYQTGSLQNPPGSFGPVEVPGPGASEPGPKAPEPAVLADEPRPVAGEPEPEAEEPEPEAEEPAAVPAAPAAAVAIGADGIRRPALRPGATEEAASPKTTKNSERTRKKGSGKSRRPRVLAGLGLAAVIAAIAVALSLGGDDDASAPAQAGNPEPPTAPTAPQAPAEPAQPEKPAEPQKPAKPAEPAQPQVALGPRFQGPGFSVRAPEGWTRSVKDGGLVIASGSGDVSLTIYSEKRPTLDIDGLATGTAQVLTGITGAPATQEPTTRAFGHQGLEIKSASGDAVVTGFGVIAGPYRYVIVRSVSNSASASDRRELTTVEDNLQLG